MGELIAVWLRGLEATHLQTTSVHHVGLRLRILHKNTKLSTCISVQDVLEGWKQGEIATQCHRVSLKVVGRCIFNIGEGQGSSLLTVFMLR